MAKKSLVDKIVEEITPKVITESCWTCYDKSDVVETGFNQYECLNCGKKWEIFY
jgi:hypothetical protein